MLQCCSKTIKGPAPIKKPTALLRQGARPPAVSIPTFFGRPFAGIVPRNIQAKMLS